MTSRSRFAIVAAAFACAAMVPQNSLARGPEQSSNIRVINHFEYSGGTDIDFRGDRVYFMQRGLAADGRTWIVDISQDRPRVIGKVPCGGFQNDVATITHDVIALGNHWGACGAQPSHGVNLLDVSDPSTPMELGFSALPAGSHTLTKHPTKPLIYTSSSFNEQKMPSFVVDASDPKNPDTTPLDRQACHDISFHFSREAQLGFCAAGSVATEIWDMKDPLNPKVLATIEDRGIAYHHLAVASPDGKYLAIGDEDDRGSCSGEKEEREFGAVSIYDISDPHKPKMAGFINVPRGPHTCWAHNFNFIPGTRMLVIGWWQAGTSVFDLTDPQHPKEIAYFQPDTQDVWSSYWYRGRIYINSGSGGWVIEVESLRGSQ